MMHHPNMHHPPMSGHPPQHMPAHQGMPGHHQMPPHQMHRENRHVTLTRVPLGPSQPGGLGAHALGQHMGMGVPPPHHGQQRPPHPIRTMPHHPPTQHHSMPQQQMKPMRRPYLGGGYGPGAPAAMPPPYNAPPETAKTETKAPAAHDLKPLSSGQAAAAKLLSDLEENANVLKPLVVPPSSASAATAASSTATEPAGVAGASGEATASSGGATSPAEGAERGGAGDSEAARAPPPQANSKEKTPMCLVNELARYNKIKHQYRLTSEMGPAHKKIFTVTLRLGETEEYTAEGSSIKRAQHAAASAALTATAYPPPPPRALPLHASPNAHQRHSGAVMPTVELNALAMKLCQPAVYTSVPPVPAAPRPPRARHAPPPPFRMHPPFVPPVYHQRMLNPGLIYRVRVCVGGRSWLGEGTTPQGARHDAAARALQDLRPPQSPGAQPPPPQPDSDPDTGDSSPDLLNEVKSPVSLVHELALKRNLSVGFTVKSERGPPHMRVFITTCTVGDMDTEGEGNGKKVSKRRAAERMLEEMRQRWPPALLRARPQHDKRKQPNIKKKPRNLIKEGSEGAAPPTIAPTGGVDNPISRLAVARHAARARSPQYRVVEERGQARRREFLVQCEAPPHCATGIGPNKKTAKRRAALNVLLAMELSGASVEPPGASAKTEATINGSVDATKTSSDAKRKEGDAAGGASSDVRQPVPGVLLMDYQKRSGQPPQPNGVSETSATGGSGGNTPGAKDQLMYLSQLLGFSVQFSDFPKRNHGEYLSLVSLSTEPPVMCHGGGPSTAHSHEQCSRAALRALALMGLDAPNTGAQSAPAAAAAAAAPKPGAVSNGISE